MTLVSSSSPLLYLYLVRSNVSPWRRQKQRKKKRTSKGKENKEKEGESPTEVHPECTVVVQEVPERKEDLNGR